MRGWPPPLLEEHPRWLQILLAVIVPAVLRTEADLTIAGEEPAAVEEAETPEGEAAEGEGAPAEGEGEAASAEEGGEG